MKSLFFMLTKLILVPILVKNLRRRHNSEKQAKKSVLRHFLEVLTKKSRYL